MLFWPRYQLIPALSGAFKSLCRRAERPPFPVGAGMKRALVILLGLALRPRSASWILTSPELAAGRARAGAGRRAGPRERPGDVLRRRLRLLPCDAGPGRPHAARRRPARCHRPSAPSIRPTSRRIRATASAAGPPAQFLRAMRGGVSPDGRHYYPAFPYTSYQRMAPSRPARPLRVSQDAAGRAGARARPRPAVPLQHPAGPRAVEARLPRRQACFSARSREEPRAGTGAPISSRAPGHCAECHSARNALGVIPAERRFAGGPNPGGQGLGPEHHAGQDRHRRLVEGRHGRGADVRPDARAATRSARTWRRSSATRRNSRRRRPRRDRRVSQVAAAAGRRGRRRSKRPLAIPSPPP